MSPRNPTESVTASLAIINLREPAVHALTCVTDSQAHDAAEALEKGRRGVGVGPLWGRPYVAKDLIDTEGIATEAGSAVLKGRIPSTNATVIDRMNASGAVLVGKAHTHEFAYGVTTPATHNPLDLDRTAGGSSGGSAAAVAAGYCDLSLGTDTMGSVRIPAALCGVVGLRPTYGRVPTDGVVPLSWSLDAVGPITRTVRDAAEMLNVISGQSDRDINSVAAPAPHASEQLELGVKGLTLGVPMNYFFDSIQPEVEQAVRSAIDILERAGATIRKLEIPLLDIALSAGFAVSLPESADAHREWIGVPNAPYGEDVRPYIELGLLRPGYEYVRAQRVRRVIAEEWFKATSGVNAVLAPMVPCTAPLKSDEQVELPGGPEGVVAALLRLTAPASVIGLPALSVPCHGVGASLPIGLQILGRPLDEAMVLRVGAAVEAEVNAPRLALDERIPV